MLVTQLIIFDIYAIDNSINYNLLCQPSNFFQAVLYQFYQLRPFQHVYQYAKEKKIYQIDNKLIWEIEKDKLNINNSYFKNKGYDKL